jgi:hypothetical protein
MSSTGFFHSRLCGTLADAGCWAFMLGVIVIHPPKKTQPHAKFDLVAAHGAVAVGTYDAGSSLRSLPGKALRSSLLLDQGVTDTDSCIANAALAYTIVGARRGTVNSVFCETPGRVTSTVTALSIIADT